MQNSSISAKGRIMELSELLSDNFYLLAALFGWGGIFYIIYLEKTYYLGSKYMILHMRKIFVALNHVYDTEPDLLCKLYFLLGGESAENSPYLFYGKYYPVDKERLGHSMFYRWYIKTVLSPENAFTLISFKSNSKKRKVLCRRYLPVSGELLSGNAPQNQKYELITDLNIQNGKLYHNSSLKCEKNIFSEQFLNSLTGVFVVDHIESIQQFKKTGDI